MPSTLPLKRIPWKREVLIWFTLSMAVGIFFWLMDVRNFFWIFTFGSFKYLVLCLSIPLFFWLNGDILFGVFYSIPKLCLVELMKPWEMIAKFLIGLLATFIAGMNLQWYGDTVASFLLPELDIHFRSICEQKQLELLLGIFGTGMIIGTFVIVYQTMKLNLQHSFSLLREQDRLKQELKAAHDMQMGLVPKEDPIVKGLDISGICLPANEVGGDFFDYVWLDKKKTKLGIALADVSGKAMKAAMTAVMTSGMLYSEVQKSKSPREILARINQPLYLRTDKPIFTALSFAVLDTRVKKLTYSSAGQSMPILL